MSPWYLDDLLSLMTDDEKEKLIDLIESKKSASPTPESKYNPEYLDLMIEHIQGTRQ